MLSSNPHVRNIQINNIRRRTKDLKTNIKGLFIALIIIRVYYLVRTKQINPIVLLPVYNGFQNWLNTRVFTDFTTTLNYYNKYKPTIDFFKELSRWRPTPES